MNIYPYEFELLASMLTFKFTKGLCLDFKRLGKPDYEAFHDEMPSIGYDTLSQFLGGHRPPPQNTLDILCDYLSDWFPYKTWEELSEKEYNETFVVYYKTWGGYKKDVKYYYEGSQANKIMLMKAWAYRRTVRLKNANVGFYSNLSTLDENYEAVYANPIQPYEEKKLSPKNEYDDGMFIATIDDIYNWGWDCNKLLNHLIGLDYETIDGLNNSQEGSTEQWSPCFFKSPDCWRLLCTRPREIVGYYSFFVLSDDLENKMREGNLLESDITEAEVIDVRECENQPLSYFVSMLGIRENYRKKGLPVLVDAFMDNLKLLQENGKSITEFYTYALTEQGKTFCKALGFKAFPTNGEITPIYIATFEDLISSRHLRDKR